MLPVITQVGKERGFTLIFNKFQSGLVYADEAVDVTDDVLKRFNTTVAVPVSPPAAPAGPRRRAQPKPAPRKSDDADQADPKSADGIRVRSRRPEPPSGGSGRFRRPRIPSSIRPGERRQDEGTGRPDGPEAGRDGDVHPGRRGARRRRASSGRRPRCA